MKEIRRVFRVALIVLMVHRYHWYRSNNFPRWSENQYQVEDREYWRSENRAWKWVPRAKTKASSINKGKWKQRAATIRKYECQTLPERSTKTRRGCKIISFREASTELEMYILSTRRNNFDFRIINFPFANTNFHKKSYQRITSIFHRISVEIIGKVLIKWPSISKVVRESR